MKSMATTSALARSAAILLLWLAVPPAHAQFCGAQFTPCDPNDVTAVCFRPPDPTPACRLQPSNGCSNCNKSPCLVGSGTYFTFAKDVEIPTPGFPLTAQRLYLSSHAVDGPLGYGWVSSLASRLYYAAYANSANTFYREADVVLPDGMAYAFRDTAGTFAPPAGRTDVLVRNADGSFDLTLQRTRSVMHFASDGTLRTMTDDFGNTLSYAYDTNGRLQRVADTAGSGRYFDVTWGADGRIAAIQDLTGRTFRYTFDGQGTLTIATDQANRSTHYSYLPGKFGPLLSTITDHWNRPVASIAFDGNGRTTSYTEEGETYTYTYGYQGNAARTAKTDSTGFTRVYPFSGGGLVTDEIPQPGTSGPTTHTDYNANGMPTRFVDEVSVTTLYTYNARNNLTSKTRDATGTFAVRFDYVYDSNFPDSVVSITPVNPTTGVRNPDWAGIRYDYYPPGSTAPGALFHIYRLRSDGVQETTTTYTYNARGQMLSETNATGATIDYGYDANGNLSSITRPANNDGGTRPVTQYGYDTSGRPTAVIDPLNHVTTLTYDELDRIRTTAVQIS